MAYITSPILFGEYKKTLKELHKLTENSDKWYSLSILVGRAIEDIERIHVKEDFTMTPHRFILENGDFRKITDYFKKILGEYEKNIKDIKSSDTAKIYGLITKLKERLDLMGQNFEDERVKFRSK
ncbi:MAG: hypothetical protein QXD48_00960 [Candidatus Aenigmatarchaeota archaeon]